MKRPLLMALVLLIAASSLQKAAAQNFFERLFGLPQQGQPAPPPQAIPAQPSPAPQRRIQRPQHTTAKPAQEAKPAPAVEPPPAPYEKDMLRLAEIIGSLAFLRPLCAAPDASEWPKQMRALLEAEGTSPGRRERLTGAYNQGYQAFGLTYRVCTTSAREASDRYLKEGSRLTQSVSNRYGGG